MGNRYLFHIEILRTFALLCVIVFHVVGMIDSRIPLFSTLPMKNFILQTTSQLVGLAVPLFLFIAGYLYKPVAKNQTITFIRKKLARLWIPYCAFTILIMLISDFFDFRSFISGGFYHLWFLTALFWCFICSLLVDYSSYWSFVLLPITLAVSLVHIPPFLGLQDFSMVLLFCFRCDHKSTSQYYHGYKAILSLGATVRFVCYDHGLCSVPLSSTINHPCIGRISSHSCHLDII